MLKRTNVWLAGLILIVGFGIMTIAPVSAEESTDTTTTSAEEKQEKLEKARQEAKERAAAAKEAALAKAKETKEKICAARTNNITKIIKKAAEQAQKRVEYLDKAANRIKEFYTTKGLSVSNYEALVADVNLKREAALAKIEATKGLTFECGSDQGQTKGQQLRTALQSLHSSVKEYRTSIKNLLVAVKTAAGKKEE